MTTEALGRLAPIALPSEALHENSLKRTLLTANGVELFADNPDCREVFLDRTQRLIDPSLARPADCTYIGGGRYGQVYELPGFEELCFKISTPQTMRIRKYHPDTHASPPSLTAELKLMNAIQKYLAKRPEHGINAPRQYTAAAFENGTALLQERIPGEFESLKDICKRETIPDDELREQEKLLIERVKKISWDNGTALRYR